MITLASCPLRKPMIRRVRLLLLILSCLNALWVCGFTASNPSFKRTTTTNAFMKNKSVHRRWTNIHSTASDTTSSSGSGGDDVAVTPSSSSSTEIWTAEKLIQFARQKGVTVSITTLGPGFRVVGRATPSVASASTMEVKTATAQDNSEQDNEDSSIMLGYVEGFTRGSILHLDKMQVFASKVKLADQTCPDFDRMGGTIFGVGMLLGYLALLHGRDRKCRMAEFLAIDDEDFQHRRLVRYYRRGGFDVVKYVGEEWKDIPDRLVWGGCGTLMSKEVNALLLLWTQILQRAEQQSKQ